MNVGDRHGSDETSDDVSVPGSFQFRRARQVVPDGDDSDSDLVSSWSSSSRSSGIHILDSSGVIQGIKAHSFHRPGDVHILDSSGIIQGIVHRVCHPEDDDGDDAMPEEADDQFSEYDLYEDDDGNDVLPEEDEVSTDVPLDSLSEDCESFSEDCQSEDGDDDASTSCAASMVPKRRRLHDEP